MNPELIQAWASMATALAWPIVALMIALLLPTVIIPILRHGGILRLHVGDVEVTVQPAEGIRPPSVAPEGERKQLTQNVTDATLSPRDPLPLDYYFLNHTSFLRRDKQDEFRQRTGVPLDHYDIRVILDSYYDGALVRVKRVEYYLHRSYPEPIQIRSNPADKFLLKELANGEYVLMAKVYLNDRKEPVLLQRYITLWTSGPRLA